MTNTKTDEIFVTPFGAIGEIAKIVGCSYPTVRNALRHKSTGPKAERVRQVYRAKYMNNK